MGGNVTNDDDDLPNLDDEDDGNESTVAMEAPSFDLPEAPPARPAAPSSARAPAAPPRPPSAASPSAPRAPMAGAPARAPGTPGPGRAGGVGKSTVIGLAPPAPRPGAMPTPASPRAPVAVPSPPRPASSPDRLEAKKPKESESPPSGEEAATVAVPKDVLDRVRSDPKAALEVDKADKPTEPPMRGGVARIVHDEDALAGEETKAVSHEDLLRPQPPHVVVGAGGSGDDATLALAPESNEGFRAPAPDPMQPSPLGDLAPNPPAFPAPYGQSTPASFAATVGVAQSSSQQPGQAGQWSSGHMPVAPPMPPPGMQPHPGGPMMPPQAPPGMGGPGPYGQQPPPYWGQQQAAQAPGAPKISGQMLLLLVVGFVCLAIFVTGIVLFVSTKF